MPHFYTQGSWGTERSKFQPSQNPQSCWRAACLTTLLDHTSVSFMEEQGPVQKEGRRTQRCFLKRSHHMQEKGKHYFTLQLFIRCPQWPAIMLRSANIDGHDAHPHPWRGMGMVTTTTGYGLLYSSCSTEYFTCRISFNLHHNGDRRVCYNYPNFTNEEMMERKV